MHHLRHKPPTPLARPRELVVACAPLRSNVNLSRIVRTAGTAGVRRVIAGGNPNIDAEIARDAVDYVAVEPRRSLAPILKKLKAEGYAAVGLEQTDESACLYDFKFARRTALVVGNEREGLTEDLLALLDAAVEIPVYGQPHSHNVATAASIAIYEYCRQFPEG